MISDLKHQYVLVRVDFNVPLDEHRQVRDDTRIRMALPTIRQLIDQKARVILMSHLGRPLKKLRPDGTIDREKFSLQPVAEHLATLVGAPVHFAPDCVGPQVDALRENLQPGEILLLENTRFHEGETKGDPRLAAQLAAHADFFINDAFGAAHREHASTATIARHFDKDHKSFGLLMDSELRHGREMLDNPRKPLVAIIGGAKVSDKIGLLDALLNRASDILIGGAMAYTFVKAQGGKTGKSLVEDDKLDLARRLLEKADEKEVRVHLPEDSVIADDFSADAKTDTVASDAIPDGWMGLDIGPVATKRYREVIRKAASILWNGPMGVFEMAPFAQGTMEVAAAVADATDTGAFSLIGGGDSVAAVNKAGLDDRISFISTGGGAMLELLEGKSLPGVTAILE
jgi:phosphoglycerate kinase